MHEAVVVWENNRPVVKRRECFPIAEITNVAERILAEPYYDPLGLYPKDITKGEVLIRELITRAIDGDNIATRELFDRLLGKPKIQIEKKQLTMTYQDLLDEIDRGPKSHTQSSANETEIL